MTNSTENNDQQALQAKLLLATQYTNNGHGDCIDEPRLAAYIDNQLSDKQAQQCKAHIAHCDDCFELWHQTYQIKQFITCELANEKESEIENKPNTKPSLLAMLVNWIQAHKLPTGLAAALSIVLVAILLVPNQPYDLHQLQASLEQSYQYQPKTPAQPQDWFAQTSSSRSFTLLSKTDRFAEDHFFKGVVQGISQLHQGEQWQAISTKLNSQANVCNTADVTCIQHSQVYQAIGKWTALVHSQCLSQHQPQSGFWQQQQNTLVALQQAIDFYQLDSSLAIEINNIGSSIEPANLCSKLSPILLR